MFFAADVASHQLACEVCDGAAFVSSVWPTPMQWGLQLRNPRWPHTGWAATLGVINRSCAMLLAVGDGKGEGGPPAQSTAIGAVIRADSTQDAVIDISEGFVDAFLRSDAIDAVPILRSIVGVWRGLGERLIITIDAAGALLKAKLIGQAFRGYLDGQCDKSTLRRTIDAIGQALTEDLHELITTAPTEIPDSTYNRLHSLGLMSGGPKPLADEGQPPNYAVASPLGALLI